MILVNLEWIPPRCFSAVSKIQNSFQDSCIKQTISFEKKWLWSFSFLLKWPFLEIPPIPRFRFDSIAQNQNAECAKIFKFSINSSFYQTKSSDTILILETMNTDETDETDEYLLEAEL